MTSTTESNYYFMKLKKMGESVIKKESIYGTTSRSIFSCGCKRDYRVDLNSLTDHEFIEPLRQVNSEVKKA